MLTEKRKKIKNIGTTRYPVWAKRQLFISIFYPKVPDKVSDKFQKVSDKFPDNFI